jgi:hypothetical protein
MVSKLKKQGIPQNDDGSYDLRAVYLWDRERTPERGQGAESEKTLEALLRWRTIRADREELALRRESGELALVADFKQYLNERAGELRSNLENLAARLGGLLVGQNDRRAIERVIAVEVEALMATWTRRVPYNDETASAIVAESRGMSLDEQKGERSRMERTVPGYLKWQPIEQLFTDIETNAKVRAEDVRKYEKEKLRAEGWGLDAPAGGENEKQQIEK